MPYKEKPTLMNADQRPVKRPVLAEWQQRVLEEASANDRKLLSLTRFMESEAFKDVDKDHAKLLEEQSKVMKKYSDVLRKRIELF